MLVESAIVIAALSGPVGTPPDDLQDLPATEPVIAARRVATADRIAVVGDSITWEHADAYDQVLTDCGAEPAVIDALPGRMITTTDGNPFGPIRSGLAAIDEIERTVDPDTWLIELGVNDVNVGVFDDGGIVSAIDDVLALIDPDDTVIWVGTWTVGPRSHLADEFTDTLATYDRLTVVDWPSVASDLVYDGLHPTEAGAREIARRYCTKLHAPAPTSVPMRSTARWVAESTR